MNPCPFGWYEDSEKECTCSKTMVSRYQKCISGSLLDRIDIHVEVPRVDSEKLSSDRLGEPSSAVSARVEAARERQQARFEGTPLSCNDDMGPAGIRQCCQVDEAAQSLLKPATKQMHVSARACHRVLKLGRTIADLTGIEDIQTAHIAEAIKSRPRRTV